jgi:hypothetical protein
MLEKLDRSVWVLIGANLIPLVGVLFWGWSTFEVVALYWLENVIIGVINVLKMITCSPDPGLMRSMMEKKIAEKEHLSIEEQTQVDQARKAFDKFGGNAGALNHGVKFFLIPFFAVHYGGFCLGHGFFVFFLLGREHAMKWSTSESEMLFELVQQTVTVGGLWAALGLLLSHLYSFATNFIGKGEYRRTAAPMLMAAPYGRIVILHIAIIFGAFATMTLGSPVPLLALLVIGKIILDLKMHLRSHRKLQAQSS